MGGRVPEIGLILVVVTRWYSEVSVVCEVKVLLEIDPLFCGLRPTHASRAGTKSVLGWLLYPKLRRWRLPSARAAPVRRHQSLMSGLDSQNTAGDLHTAGDLARPRVADLVSHVRTFFTGIKSRSPRQASGVSLI
jgi:hypothetical protein